MRWYEMAADIAGTLGFFLSVFLAILGWWHNRLKCRILDAEITSLLFPGDHMAFVLTLVVHNASQKPLHVGGVSLSTLQEGKATSWRCAWDRRLVKPSPEYKVGTKDHALLQQALAASKAPPCTVAALGTERVGFLFRSRSGAQLSEDLLALADQIHQWESSHSCKYEIDAQLPPPSKAHADEPVLNLEGHLSLNGKSHPFHLKARFVLLRDDAKAIS